MSLFNHLNPGKILCFGELLLRIIHDAEGEWLENNVLPFYVGGAELNVVTALALWGLPSKYVTALPQNGMTSQITQSLQNKHIDTSDIAFGDGRLGLYFLTKERDLKHDALVYDRANSAFAGLKPGVIDWDKVLEGVSWFHFSAICPAISQDVADVCKEALEAADKKGITISVDMNYRSKLWQYDKTPLEIMPGLVKHCDLIMGNVWSTQIMLGINLIPDIHESGQKSVYLKEALNSSENVMDQYPKCKAVANTFRFDSSNDITYYSSLYLNNQFFNSKEYKTNYVIDKVGSGDCYMAGLIYGFYNNLEPQETLEFATAAAFEKLFVNGDATHKTVEEIKRSIP
jgi:2-dehydro-3-deoxygluconokinase